MCWATLLTPTMGVGKLRILWRYLVDWSRPCWWWSQQTLPPPWQSWTSLVRRPSHPCCCGMPISWRAILLWQVTQRQVKVVRWTLVEHHNTDRMAVELETTVAICDSGEDGAIWRTQSLPENMALQMLDRHREDEHGQQIHHAFSKTLNFSTDSGNGIKGFWRNWCWQT